MSTNGNTNIDYFLENLKDLNHVAKQISREIERKNQILRGGLDESEKYRKILDQQSKQVTRTSSK